MVIVIAAQWSWLAYRACSVTKTPAPQLNDSTIRLRKITHYLLLAHCYIFCAAWTVHLMGEGPWSADARGWWNLAMTIAFQVPVAFIERASPCRRLQTGGS